MGKLGYHEADAKALLGMPEDIATACMIPLGYTRPRAGTSVAHPQPPKANFTHDDRCGHREHRSEI